MKKGDKVVCPGGYEATVVETSLLSLQVTVKFDDKGLIPPEMDFPRYQLFVIGGTKICECGGGKEPYDHFKFCPAYKSGYEDFE